jgi:predicted nucleic acid-binding protein
MKTPRIYADTSVFGGCFDEEFERESRQLFEEVCSGRFILVVSETVIEESIGICFKKYITVRPRYELYDLEADSWEQQNLAEISAYAGIRDELHSALSAGCVKPGTPCWTDPSGQFITMRF